MIHMLANAAAPDSPNSNVEFVLIGTMVFAIVGVAGFIPMFIARYKRRKKDAIRVAVLLWSLLSGVSVVYSIMEQMRWSAETQRRIESGYYETQSASDDAPKFPIVLWAGLAVSYGFILLWASRRQIERTDPPAKQS